MCLKMHRLLVLSTRLHIDRYTQPILSALDNLSLAIYSFLYMHVTIITYPIVFAGPFDLWRWAGIKTALVHHSVFAGSASSVRLLKHFPKDAIGRKKRLCLSVCLSSWCLALKGSCGELIFGQIEEDLGLINIKGVHIKQITNML